MYYVKIKDMLRLYFYIFGTLIIIAFPLGVSMSKLLNDPTPLLVVISCIFICFCILILVDFVMTTIIQGIAWLLNMVSDIEKEIKDIGPTPIERHKAIEQLQLISISFILLITPLNILWTIYPETSILYNMTLIYPILILTYCIVYVIFVLLNMSTYNIEAIEKT